MKEYPKTVYMTKYALTKGTEKVSARDWDNGAVIVYIKGCINDELMLFPGEYADSLEVAISQVHKKIAAKRHSIQKQLRKLEILEASLSKLDL